VLEIKVGSLALDTIDNPELRPALGDLIIETGWIDHRAIELMGVDYIHMQPGDLGGKVFSPDHGYVDISRDQTVCLRHQNYVRAVAAICLFGAWPKAWDLATYCQREPRRRSKVA
jgi:hypothetical protein